MLLCSRYVEEGSHRGKHTPHTSPIWYWTQEASPDSNCHFKTSQSMGNADAASHHQQMGCDWCLQRYTDVKRRTTPYPHTMIGIELGTATLNTSACFMQTLTVCDNTSSNTDFSVNDHTVWTASLLDPPHKTICLLTKTFAVENFETPTYSRTVCIVHQLHHSATYDCHWRISCSP